MARSQQRQQPMSISTVNLDVDDITTLHREEHIPSHNFGDETLSEPDNTRSRRLLILFIVVFIIIILISLAGFIMAICALVLSKSESTNSISTTTVASTSATTPPQCSPSPATYFQYTTVTPPQCLSYTLNTDATRNIGYTSSINYCDDVAPFSNTTSVWIRFQEPAGTLLASSPVSPNYCGTVVTGWYAGQYPSPVFTTATSIVCFYYATNTCSSCATISVTNCLNFYVYLLPEPQSCNYRYCTL
ncbi:unnamed protein product [Rotaria socialis]|uniref:Uncharacterized protein n=3 Tax=Rotaria socialis TaxID=392032 RepID=A0A820XED5_9BILA|nr:unnamed protein product [Rotaria socialis]CAF3689209.1 unnamed protein product [Rotaria socialis]CAF3714386.1 unnamed protein product [Rotaria socialis]CAF4328790.1 unnamed protein product [Rotaria socialis]CAF4531803.1 unnamed protein product [Rotaria socialis]